jgi:hypothetical protein
VARMSVLAHPWTCAQATLAWSDATTRSGAIRSMAEGRRGTAASC